MTTATDKILAHADALDRLGSFEVPLGMTLIESITVSSASANVTLPSSGSFSQAYRSIYITGVIRTDRNATLDGIQVQFDGDSGSNYDYVDGRMSTATAVWTATASAGTGDARFILCPGNTAPASSFAVYDIRINGYSLTGIHKGYNGTFSYKTANNAASIFMGQVGGMWRSTSAIGTLKLFSSTVSNIAASSVISVYGIY